MNIIWEIVKLHVLDIKQKDEYEESIKYVHQILKGNIFQVIEHLKDLMNKYSEEYKFEQAQIIKDKISILEKYRSKSMIVNPRIDDIEVYSIAEEDECCICKLSESDKRSHCSGSNF